MSERIIVAWLPHGLPTKASSRRNILRNSRSGPPPRSQAGTARDVVEHEHVAEFLTAGGLFRFRGLNQPDAGLHMIDQAHQVGYDPIEAVLPTFGWNRTVGAISALHGAHHGRLLGMRAYL